METLSAVENHTVVLNKIINDQNATDNPCKNLLLGGGNKQLCCITKICRLFIQIPV
jgi:hypothetical protein